MHDALQYFDETTKKSLEFLHSEFSGLQIGHAAPSLVENILIDAYGTKQPIKNLANITVDGPQSLVISPWDRTLLSKIENAIRNDSALGLAPINDGHIVRLNIPALTEERRKNLTKIVSKMAEEAKIVIRKHRHEALEKIKKDESLSEDEQKFAEKELQKKVDMANENIEVLAKKKNEDIMKI